MSTGVVVKEVYQINKGVLLKEGFKHNRVKFILVGYKQSLYPAAGLFNQKIERFERLGVVVKEDIFQSLSKATSSVPFCSVFVAELMEHP